MPRACDEGNRLVEVHWAVGRRRRRGAHGAGDNDGLIRLAGKVQAIGGLVEGVGAVRHNETRNGLVLGELVDGFCHLDPVGACHFGRADVAHLRAANVCKLFDAGYACEQRGDVELARGVPGGLSCVAGAGDSAARREQDDGGKPRSSLSETVTDRPVEVSWKP